MTLSNVKSFDLAGITFPVKYLKEVDNDPKTNGLAIPDRHEVHIRNDLDPERAGQVFCHELVHCILSTMNAEINDDEKFVDVFGTFLHNALKTIK